MAAGFSLFNKNPKLVVLFVCAIKLAITIPIWAEKASQTSFLGLLELANSTLTDWMLFIFAAYALLQYIGGYGVCSHRRARRHTSTSSVVSRSSRWSGSSIGSSHSSDSGDNRSVSSVSSVSSVRSSGYYANSETSSFSFTSATTSVIEHRTRISIPMDRFLFGGRDDSFRSALGMLEGNLGVLASA
ncbi:hypothetical protein TWF281_004364 [Arthrobotrys megalospora]